MGRSENLSLYWEKGRVKTIYQSPPHGQGYKLVRHRKLLRNRRSPWWYKRQKRRQFKVIILPPVSSSGDISVVPIVCARHYPSTRARRVQNKCNVQTSPPKTNHSNTNESFPSLGARDYLKKRYIQPQLSVLREASKPKPKVALPRPSRSWHAGFTLPYFEERKRKRLLRNELRCASSSLAKTDLRRLHAGLSRTSSYSRLQAKLDRRSRASVLNKRTCRQKPDNHKSCLRKLLDNLIKLSYPSRDSSLKADEVVGRSPWSDILNSLFVSYDMAETVVVRGSPLVEKVGDSASGNPDDDDGDDLFYKTAFEFAKSYGYGSVEFVEIQHRRLPRRPKSFSSNRYGLPNSSTNKHGNPNSLLLQRHFSGEDRCIPVRYVKTGPNTISKRRTQCTSVRESILRHAIPIEESVKKDLALIEEVKNDLRKLTEYEPPPVLLRNSETSRHDRTPSATKADVEGIIESASLEKYADYLTDVCDKIYKSPPTSLSRDSSKSDVKSVGVDDTAEPNNASQTHATIVAGSPELPDSKSMISPNKSQQRKKNDPSKRHNCVKGNRSKNNTPENAEATIESGPEEIKDENIDVEIPTHTTFLPSGMDKPSLPYRLGNSLSATIFSETQAVHKGVSRTGQDDSLPVSVIDLVQIHDEPRSEYECEHLASYIDYSRRYRFQNPPRRKAALRSVDTSSITRTRCTRQTLVPYPCQKDPNEHIVANKLHKERDKAESCPNLATKLVKDEAIEFNFVPESPETSRSSTELMGDSTTKVGDSPTKPHTGDIQSSGMKPPAWGDGMNTDNISADVLDDSLKDHLNFKNPPSAAVAFPKSNEEGDSPRKKTSSPSRKPLQYIDLSDTALSSKLPINHEVDSVNEGSANNNKSGLEGEDGGSCSKDDPDDEDYSEALEKIDDDNVNNNAFPGSQTSLGENNIMYTSTPRNAKERHKKVSNSEIVENQGLRIPVLSQRQNSMNIGRFGRYNQEILQLPTIPAWSNIISSRQGECDSANPTRTSVAGHESHQECSDYAELSSYIGGAGESGIDSRRYGNRKGAYCGNKASQRAFDHSEAPTHCSVVLAKNLDTQTDYQDRLNFSNPQVAKSNMRCLNTSYIVSESKRPNQTPTTNESEEARTCSATKLGKGDRLDNNPPVRTTVHEPSTEDGYSMPSTHWNQTMPTKGRCETKPGIDFVHKLGSGDKLDENPPGQTAVHELPTVDGCPMPHERTAGMLEFSKAVLQKHTFIPMPTYSRTSPSFANVLGKKYANVEIRKAVDKQGKSGENMRYCSPCGHASCNVESYSSSNTNNNARGRDAVEKEPLSSVTYNTVSIPSVFSGLEFDTRSKHIPMKLNSKAYILSNVKLSASSNTENGPFANVNQDNNNSYSSPSYVRHKDREGTSDSSTYADGDPTELERELEKIVEENNVNAEHSSDHVYNMRSAQSDPFGSNIHTLYTMDVNASHTIKRQPHGNRGRQGEHNMRRSIDPRTFLVSVESDDDVNDGNEGGEVLERTNDHSDDGNGKKKSVRFAQGPEEKLSDYSGYDEVDRQCGLGIPEQPRVEHAYPSSRATVQYSFPRSREQSENSSPYCPTTENYWQTAAENPVTKLFQQSTQQDGNAPASSETLGPTSMWSRFRSLRRTNPMYNPALETAGEETMELGTNRADRTFENQNVDNPTLDNQRQLDGHLLQSENELGKLLKTINDSVHQRLGSLHEMVKQKFQKTYNLITNPKQNFNNLEKSKCSDGTDTGRGIKCADTIQLTTTQAQSKSPSYGFPLDVSKYLAANKGLPEKMNKTTDDVTQKDEAFTGTNGNIFPSIHFNEVTSNNTSPDEIPYAANGSNAARYTTDRPGITNIQQVPCSSDTYLNHYRGNNHPHNSRRHGRTVTQPMKGRRFHRSVTPSPRFKSMEQWRQEVNQPVKLNGNETNSRFCRSHQHSRSCRRRQLAGEPCWNGCVPQLLHAKAGTSNMARKTKAFRAQRSRKPRRVSKRSRRVKRSKAKRRTPRSRTGGRGRGKMKSASRKRTRSVRRKYRPRSAANRKRGRSSSKKSPAKRKRIKSLKRKYFSRSGTKRRRALPLKRNSKRIYRAKHKKGSRLKRKSVRKNNPKSRKLNRTSCRFRRASSKRRVTNKSGNNAQFEKNPTEIVQPRIPPVMVCDTNQNQKQRNKIQSDSKSPTYVIGPNGYKHLYCRLLRRYQYLQRQAGAKCESSFKDSKSCSRERIIKNMICKFRDVISRCGVKRLGALRKILTRSTRICLPEGSKALKISNRSPEKSKALLKREVNRSVNARHKKQFTTSDDRSKRTLRDSESYNERYHRRQQPSLSLREAADNATTPNNSANEYRRDSSDEMFTRPGFYYFNQGSARVPEEMNRANRPIQNRDTSLRPVDSLSLLRERISKSRNKSKNACARIHRAPDFQRRQGCSGDTRKEEIAGTSNRLSDGHLVPDYIYDTENPAFQYNAGIRRHFRSPETTPFIFADPGWIDSEERNGTLEKLYICRDGYSSTAMLDRVESSCDLKQDIDEGGYEWIGEPSSRTRGIYNQVPWSDCPLKKLPTPDFRIEQTRNVAHKIVDYQEQYTSRDNIPKRTITCRQNDDATHSKTSLLPPQRQQQSQICFIPNATMEWDPVTDSFSTSHARIATGSHDHPLDLTYRPHDSRGRAAEGEREGREWLKYSAYTNENDHALDLTTIPGHRHIIYSGEDVCSGEGKTVLPIENAEKQISSATSTAASKPQAVNPHPRATTPRTDRDLSSATRACNGIFITEPLFTKSLWAGFDPASSSNSKSANLKSCVIQRRSGLVGNTDQISIGTAVKNLPEGDDRKVNKSITKDVEETEKRANKAKDRDVNISSSLSHKDLQKKTSETEITNHEFHCPEDPICTKSTQNAIEETSSIPEDPPSGTVVEQKCLTLPSSPPSKHPPLLVRSDTPRPLPTLVLRHRPCQNQNARKWKDLIDSAGNLSSSVFSSFPTEGNTNFGNEAHDEKSSHKQPNWPSWDRTSSCATKSETISSGSNLERFGKEQVGNMFTTEAEKSPTPTSAALHVLASECVSELNKDSDSAEQCLSVTNMSTVASPGYSNFQPCVTRNVEANPSPIKQYEEQCEDTSKELFSYSGSEFAEDTPPGRGYDGEENKDKTKRSSSDNSREQRQRWEFEQPYLIVSSPGISTTWTCYVPDQFKPRLTSQNNSCQPSDKSPLDASEKNPLSETKPFLEDNDSYESKVQHSDNFAERANVDAHQNDKRQSDAPFVSNTISYSLPETNHEFSPQSSHITPDLLSADLQGPPGLYFFSPALINVCEEKALEPNASSQGVLVPTQSHNSCEVLTTTSSCRGTQDDTCQESPNLCQSSCSYQVIDRLQNHSTAQDVSNNTAALPCEWFSSVTQPRPSTSTRSEPVPWREGLGLPGFDGSYLERRDYPLLSSSATSSSQQRDRLSLPSASDSIRPCRACPPSTDQSKENNNNAVRPRDSYSSPSMPRCPDIGCGAQSGAASSQGAGFYVNSRVPNVSPAQTPTPACFTETVARGQFKVEQGAQRLKSCNSRKRCAMTTDSDKMVPPPKIARWSKCAAVSQLPSSNQVRRQKLLQRRAQWQMRREQRYQHDVGNVTEEMRHFREIHNVPELIKTASGPQGTVGYVDRGSQHQICDDADSESSL